MTTASLSRARRFDINGWAFVAPALLLICAFLAYPIVQSLWMSLHSGQGTLIKFVGFGNIQRLVEDPIFHLALFNTLIFMVVQVPIMIGLALLLANCLNMPDLRYRSWLRTAIFLPCVTSLVAYSMLFKSMFAYDGIINAFLLWVGLIASPIPWLTDPFWARVALVVAVTWRWTGYNMIFYLAALQNIDKSLYEAARIDGIPPHRQFLSITLPLLKPVILFTTVTSTIGSLQLFDEPMNITNGLQYDVTLTLSLYIYKISFRYVPNFGYAATLSYVIVILIGLLAALQFLIARERD
jgi:lactose/L-arabinose transport system permease protein